MVLSSASSKWVFCYSNRAPYKHGYKRIATIFVTDMDRSIRFYTEILGLRLSSGSAIIGDRLQPGN